jgi:hypothetical protein
MYMQYLGCLGLLANCSVALHDTVEDMADDLRESIQQALDDAQAIGLPIRWRRILNRIEVEVE